MDDSKNDTKQIEQKKEEKKDPPRPKRKYIKKKDLLKGIIVKQGDFKVSFD
jgi:hypothetical protein